MQAGTAGEQTIAIGDMDHILCGAASGHNGPGAAILPEVHIVLGIERHHAPACGPGGGLDTDAVLQRSGQKAIRIGVPQVALGEKGKLMEVLDAVDILRGDPLFLHLSAVIRDVVIDMANLLDQAFTLQFANLLLGHGLNFRLIHGHEKSILTLSV